MRHRISWLLILLYAVTPMNAADPPDDPFLWLEDVEGKRALEWANAQNDRSTAVLEAVPEFDPIRARFLEIYNSSERIPYVSIRGDELRNFWQDAAHPRGIWRRTTLAEYRKADNEPWVYKGATCLPPDYRQCMIALSSGGGDAVVYREFDTAKRAFVKQGFTVPLAKSDVDWRDADSIWVTTDFGEGTLTSSGYPRRNVSGSWEDPRADCWWRRLS